MAKLTLADLRPGLVIGRLRLDRRLSVHPKEILFSPFEWRCECRCGNAVVRNETSLLRAANRTNSKASCGPRCKAAKNPKSKEFPGWNRRQDK